MPIYRCNQCGLVAEGSLLPVASQIACARCGAKSTVFDTVYYVEKLVERYFSSVRELRALQVSDNADSADQPMQAPATAVTATPSTDSATATAALRTTAIEADLHNTRELATSGQHAPLKAWFADRKIETRFDYATVDTSGFFDDAARLIGDRYTLFGELMDRVCFAYRKSHSGVNLELANLAQKDAQAINTLCRQLYSHTFFSRYHYQKQEKIVRLTLQTAPAVRQFFEGGWLEWYALMLMLEQAQTSGRAFSCARGVQVVFPNDDLHELDVLYLPQGGIPVCIECKSGEFRRDIDKCLRLRKRLGLPRSHFILCAADLDDEQAAGLSAMYEMSFVSLRALPEHLKSLSQ